MSIDYTDDPDDVCIGPVVCKDCWFGWHQHCDDPNCECDAEEHDEPAYDRR